MKIRSKIYIISGRLLYSALYPFFILRASARTRGLIFDQNNRILLVKNWVGNNSWDMPGGGLHHTESLSECLSREVYEETGIEIHKDAWRFAAKYRVYSTEFVYFSAVTQSKEPRCQNWEITDAAWFSRDTLPSNRNAFIDKILSAPDERAR